MKAWQGLDVSQVADRKIRELFRRINVYLRDSNKAIGTLVSSSAAGSGGAPASSPFIVVSNTTGLTGERALAVASPITKADGGANGSLTIGFDQAVALGNNARIAVSKNSGATVGTRRRINLIEGANITITEADDAGNEEVDVTIAAGAGSGLTLTEYEANLGAIPLYSGTFDITGLAGLTPAKQVLVQQKAAAYTGKGTLTDESEMDQILANGYVVDAATIRVYWVCQPMSGPVAGNVKVGYAVSG